MDKTKNGNGNNGKRRLDSRPRGLRHKVKRDWGKINYHYTGPGGRR